MALPWRSNFSSRDMRNDVSGFRLGGNPAPNQNPMQTLNEDVSDSWAGGSSSSAHQSMQTIRQDSSSVQTHELVSGYWGDGSSASSHYPMQTGSCFSELRDEHTNMFVPKAGRGSSSFSAQPSMQTMQTYLVSNGSQHCQHCTVTISVQDSKSNGKAKE